jgi:hypothetical protein
VSESLEGAVDREVNLGVLETVDVGVEVFVGLWRGVLCGPLTGLDFRADDGVVGDDFFRAIVLAGVAEGVELGE